MSNLPMQSDWYPLDTGLPDGMVVIAVGDVHGYSEPLRKLLDACVKYATEYAQSTLVFLGDLIDRGPDSLGTLNLALGTSSREFGQTVHLMGNHEQMLRLTLRGFIRQDQSYPPDKIWNMNGNDRFLRQIGYKLRPFGMSPRRYGQTLAEKLGDRLISHLSSLKSHCQFGNLLFVHAGLNPYLSAEEHLSQQWDILDDLHWSWIREPFLSLPISTPNLIIVHGHTPALFAGGHQMFDRHVCREGKINLDGGSYIEGWIVAGVFLKDQYLLLMSR